MISIYAIHGWQDFAAFAAWSLVVLAAATAIFRSFPAAEFGVWLDRRLQPEREAIAKIQFELAYGVLWTPQSSKAVNEANKTGDGVRAVRAALKNSGAVPLNDNERDARNKRLASNVLHSRRLRAINYLMGCAFCQHVWVAVVVYLITVPAGGWWAGLLNLSVLWSVVAGVGVGLFFKDAWYGVGAFLLAIPVAGNWWPGLLPAALAYAAVASAMMGLAGKGSATTPPRDRQAARPGECPSGNCG